MFKTFQGGGRGWQTWRGFECPVGHTGRHGDRPLRQNPCVSFHIAQIPAPRLDGSRIAAMFFPNCLERIDGRRCSLSIVLDELTAVEVHFPLSWTNFLREMFTFHCLGQISCGKCSLPVVLDEFPVGNVHFPFFDGLAKTTRNNGNNK